MKIVNKLIIIFTVSLGFLCTASTCEDGPGNSMEFCIHNTCDESIYVWNLIDKPGIDVFDPQRPLYNEPFELILPHDEVYGFHFAIPEDLNEHFKYKSTNKSIEPQINYILILKQSTYKKYSIEQLIQNRIYDAKYELSPREILKNTHILYPEEENSNIPNE